MLSGQKMQLIRIQHHLTQKQVAEAIGCSIKIISEYENNRKYISQELYLKWINALYQLEPEYKKTGRKKKKDNASN